MKKETILTVDVGGTKVLIGEVDKEGQILSQNKFKSDISSQETALNQIIDAIINYFSKQVIGDIKAIAVDIVGRVNSDKGIWYEIDPTNKNEINVSREIEKRFNLPCFIINDLTAAAEAENLLGIGNVTKNFIYLSIGTGIAGRMVVDGQIILGKNYDAGEFGHMVVDSASKVKCVCGRYGCVEPLASGLGMSNQAHELKKFNDTKLEVLPDQRVGAKELFEAYDQKDPLALAVVNQSLKATSNMVMNLVRIINPQAVRFGGGVTTGGWYLDHLQRLLDPQTMRFVKYGVKNTELDPNLIALQGCALFAFSKLLN
ncbi:ROK family protein [Companilactobacillus sp. HBUAS56275]|uniref:ROK family protein n=1 Tax=Candidatus Companilactobacillus pullicola TaxID=2838523 RepID=A0A9D1ZN71_9LACO|nr:ROK family protein [Candidatus Companilactobacillus pullicola]